MKKILLIQTMMMSMLISSSDHVKQAIRQMLLDDLIDVSSSSSLSSSSSSPFSSSSPSSSSAHTLRDTNYRSAPFELPSSSLSSSPFSSSSSSSSFTHAPIDTSYRIGLLEMPIDYRNMTEREQLTGVPQGIIMRQPLNMKPSKNLYKDADLTATITQFLVASGISLVTLTVALYGYEGVKKLIDSGWFESLRKRD